MQDPDRRLLLLGLTVLLLLAGPLCAQPPQIAGCQVFPTDNIWNVPIDTLPVAANSDALVATIGVGKNLHPDFGSGLFNGGPIGIPFIDVPGSQPPVSVSFDVPDESDPGPYPIPSDAPIEGGAASTGDRHVLVLDRDTCVLYELKTVLGTHFEAVDATTLQIDSDSGATNVGDPTIFTDGFEG